MKYNRIILFQDNLTSFNKIIYKNKAGLNLDLILGETITFIEAGKYQEHHYESFKHSLFPKGRVNPINLTDLDPMTIMVIRVRPQHLLINTTISNECIKEVLYDSHKDLLLYLFMGFKSSVLTIRPRIIPDELGLLNRFKDNMDDNLIRQSILDLLSRSDLPKESINKHIFDQAENSIEHRGDFFRIKFRGKFVMDYHDDAAIRDLIYIIYKRTFWMNAANLYKDIRGRDTSEINAIDVFKKNRERVLEKIKLREISEDTEEHNKFSRFIENSVKVSKLVPPVQYDPSEKIQWYFWPQDFDKVFR